MSVNRPMKRSRILTPGRERLTSGSRRVRPGKIFMRMNIRTAIGKTIPMSTVTATENRMFMRTVTRMRRSIRSAMRRKRPLCLPSLR